jgi:hypothetical protein
VDLLAVEQILQEIAQRAHIEGVVLHFHDQPS